MNIEPLEPRIAPATVVPYTDIDGDLVKITASTGPLDITDLVLSNGAGNPGQLRQLNLSDPGFAGANIIFTVTKAPGGDGLADVGYINAIATDLGNVTVKGDLGRIDAGNGNDADGPSLKILSVRSLGASGLATQGGAGSLVSFIAGHAAVVKVAGDVHDAFVQAGSIGSVSIGGSLDAGNIFSSTTILSVKVGRDILGGAGGGTGIIQAVGKLTSATVGGSIFGGTGGFSGAIRGGELGTVKIGKDVLGDLGNDSGSITSSTAKIGSVTIAGSLRGGWGLDSGKIESAADLGAVKIGRDVQGNAGAGSGSIFSATSLASVSIGGSLRGGSAADTGAISSSDGMGAVKIGGDILGGIGVSSGSILSLGDLAGVTIFGSLLGGSGTNSASIVSTGDTMGAVKIGRDVVGGSGNNSALISISPGKLASVTIGGSLIGGARGSAGGIFSAGDLGAVKIGGDLRGGSINGNTTTQSSIGRIMSAGRIASVSIGGSIISGIDDSTGGSISESVAILAGDDIGSLTVKGSVIGHVTANGASPVVISARGQAVQSATDLAIGKISIGGRVEFVNILAGHDFGLFPVNGDAQIGAVTVGGDWIASNLVAGAMNAASGNTNFGDANDASIGAGNLNIIAKIASISIKGIVLGSASTGTDHFGFVAQQVGSFKSLGFTAPLTPGTDPIIERAPLTADVTIREV